MDTLIIVLYLLSQWSEYVGHPDQSLARKCHGQLQDVRKSGVRARVYMAMLNTIGEICCCQMLVLYACSICFWWFINFFLMCL